jgi:hypothetical protein
VHFDKKKKKKKEEEEEEEEEGQSRLFVFFFGQMDKLFVWHNFTFNILKVL